MQNFMGMDGFIWFTGVVEDRNDPSKLGRVRVRCWDITQTINQRIPTKDLPWAHHASCDRPIYEWMGKHQHS